MAYTQLNPHFTPGARVEQISDDSSHYLLSIPSGKADKYRLAQLSDYTHRLRRKFPHRSLTLSLSARTSSDSMAGTWGFGLWNDPFGMSLGFGGRPFRVPALPNAVWFFGASKENYLSFRAPEKASGLRERSGVKSKGRASSTCFAKNAQPSALRETIPANGFLAQSFRAPRFHPLLVLAGLALPFSRKMARRLMSRVIDEHGVALSLDVTQWHTYRFEWSLKHVLFEIDNVKVSESAVSPNPPLGLVIWIDNQFAAFTPEGKIGFGVLENPEPAWLEIKDLDMG